MIRSAKGFILPKPSLEVKEAKSIWADFREIFGFKKTASKLLSQPSDNAKLNKTAVPSYGLSLAASRISGINVCTFSTPVCVNACVGWNGNGAYPSVINARSTKTKFLFEEPEAFSTILVEELSKLAPGTRVRMNVFSDIDWTASRWIFNEFTHLNFYDYTKDWNRSSLLNYKLTYSASERTTLDEIQSWTRAGLNVAVVFSTKKKDALPTEWNGIPVIDGDVDDDRWNDPSGVIVGLRAKGKMRRDKSGFVRQI